MCHNRVMIQQMTLQQTHISRALVAATLLPTRAQHWLAALVAAALITTAAAVTVTLRLVVGVRVASARARVLAVVVRPQSGCGGSSSSSRVPMALKCCWRPKRLVLVLVPSKVTQLLAPVPYYTLTPPPK